MLSEETIAYMLDDEIWEWTRNLHNGLRNEFVRHREKSYAVLSLDMNDAPIVHEVVWAVAFVRSIYD